MEPRVSLITLGVSDLGRAERLERAVGERLRRRRGDREVERPQRVGVDGEVAGVGDVLDIERAARRERLDGRGRERGVVIARRAHLANRLHPRRSWPLHLLGVPVKHQRLAHEPARHVHPTVFASAASKEYLDHSYSNCLRIS